MVNDCLVTKLKGIVENDNLPKLGELKLNISVASGITVPFLFAGTQRFTAEVSGEGHFYKGTWDNQTDITTKIENVLDTTGYRLSAGNSIVTINNKYCIYSIVLGTNGGITLNYTLDLNDLYNTTSLTDIRIGNIDDDIDVVIDYDNISMSLVRLLIASTKVKGNISNIAKNISPAYVEIIVGGVGHSYSGLTGSVEDFVRQFNPNAFGGSGYTQLRANGYLFNGNPYFFTLDISFDSSGNATIIKDGTQTIVATYDRANDTFTYNE